MKRAYVSIGSNVDAEKNIVAAITALKNNFTNLELSTVYQNTAVGFDGDDFLNLVAGFDTSLTIPELVGFFHQVERAQGRQRDEKKFSSRTLDIDLLLYANEVFESGSISIPRDEILKYAFVLQPLAELVPDYIHPVLNRRIIDLWQAFDKKDLDMKAYTLTVNC